MPTVVIETTIDAPVELCFDLARDVGVHAESAAFSSERIVQPGRMDGLLALGDIIAFEGRYLVMSYRFAARITALDRPRCFVDEMVEGAFKWLRHVHQFESEAGITIMRDIIDWESPFGFVGRAADSLFLRRHMRWFVATKQAVLKQIAEERART
jgi:ligand-binding SRPBCC domain-containing protein